MAHLEARPGQGLREVHAVVQGLDVHARLVGGTQRALGLLHLRPGNGWGWIGGWEKSAGMEKHLDEHYIILYLYHDKSINYDWKWFGRFVGKRTFRKSNSGVTKVYRTNH